MLAYSIDYITELLNDTQITPYTAAIKLFISFLLGAVIGIERQMRRRDAGMRTMHVIDQRLELLRAGKLHQRRNLHVDFNMDSAVLP